MVAERNNAPIFSRTVFTGWGGCEPCNCQNSIFIIIQKTSTCGILTKSEINVRDTQSIAEIILFEKPLPYQVFRKMK